jgi:hypothetical protein
MEHIPAIHAAKVGLRYPARVTDTGASGVALRLDLSAVAPGRNPTLSSALLFDTTVRAEAARRLKAGDAVEVVLTAVDRLFGQLSASLPAPLDWLTWNGGTVRALAQRIRDTNDDALFPILADALEDAGCAEAELLARCRTANSGDLNWLAILLAIQE